MQITRDRRSLEDSTATDGTDAPRRQRRPRSARFRTRFTLDALALALGYLGVVLTANPSLDEFGPWAATYAAIVVGGFAARQAYAPRLRREILEEFRTVVIVTGIAAMATLTIQLVVRGDATTGLVAGLWAFTAFYIGCARSGARIASVRATAKGGPTLIIGAGRVGRVVASRLLASQPGNGLVPIGFLDKEPLDDGTGDLPILGASWDLEDVVQRYGIQHAIVTFSTAPTSVVLDMVRRCERLGVTVSTVPRLYEVFGRRLTLDYFGGIPLITNHPVDPRGFRFRCKYAVERVLAAALVVLLLPSFILVALAVWLSLGSPILFRQVRVGRDGEEFEMLKFRSMRGSEPTAEDLKHMPAGLGPGGIEGRDRRTHVGRLIRNTSLDELPQLLNVVRGDMALVGPRPPLPEEAAKYSEEVRRRLLVKPGLTGLWQVSGRSDLAWADAVRLDLGYVENWSLGLDAEILLRTGSAVVKGKGAY
jgi:exopolysaccharide biosynthesis polyprenyl glycosylphosphotransferase